jgi:hypothetical protein
MREVAHVRATVADMPEPVLARYRSAMMGQALRCRARVSNVTGVREMSGAPRVDAARVDRAAMRAADVTDIHPATVTEMRAAAVSGKTAKMRCAAAEMPAAKVRCPAATEMRCATAAKVGAATTATEMRRATAAKVGHTTATATEMRRATTAKVGAATTATEMRRATTAKVGAATTTAEMRRGNCERESGNAEAQPGRQSNNNTTRHSTTPTI